MMEMQGAEALEARLPGQGLLISDFTRAHPGSTVDVVVRHPIVRDGRHSYAVAMAVTGAPRPAVERLAGQIEARYGEPVKLCPGGGGQTLLQTSIPPEAIPSPAIRFLVRFLPIVARRQDDDAPRIFVRSQGGDYRLMARRQGHDAWADALQRFSAFAAKVEPSASIQVRATSTEEEQRYRDVLASARACT